jgi:hypothetical protein
MKTGHGFLLTHPSVMVSRHKAEDVTRLLLRREETYDGCPESNATIFFLILN